MLALHVLLKNHDFPLNFRECWNIFLKRTVLLKSNDIYTVRALLCEDCLAHASAQWTLNTGLSIKKWIISIMLDLPAAFRVCRDVAPSLFSATKIFSPDLNSKVLKEARVLLNILLIILWPYSVFLVWNLLPLINIKNQGLLWTNRRITDFYHE